MKFKFLPLLLFVLLAGRSFVVAQQNTTAFNLRDLLGQAPTGQSLTEVLLALDTFQINEVFTLSTNEYEMNVYHQGYALIFNQNFILKEIQMYDSGNLYARYRGAFPVELDSGFNAKLEDFRGFKYIDYFEIDTFNKYIYYSRDKQKTSKVYFKDGYPELVKLYLSDSMLYVSDEAHKSDWGMRLIPDGKCVSGNCFNGNGRMEWPTSLVYEGEWESGIPHGEGHFEDSTGLSYTGEFKLGFLWGRGTLNVPGQYKYEGQLLYGKPAGQGKAFYTNGTKYEGNWVNGLMSGQGHFWFSEKFHYEGTFAGNQFNGQGILHSPEGYVKGSFKNGKPHGFCQQVVKRNHITLSGNWVNGKKEGEFDLFNPVTGSTKMQFKNDIEIQ